MTQKKRIEAFAKLGEYLSSDEAIKSPFLDSIASKNAWYTKGNVQKQFLALSQNLTETALQQWLEPYPDIESNKSVGLILAGNLPLVGFHDILSVLIAGFHAKIKVSSDDAGLTIFVLNHLFQIAPEFKEKIDFVERLVDYDLIIATGSNNSSRYFEYYFGKKPHIIRKNRNSVAVINGNETAEQLTGLGNDILDFFGLGCRSVSKIFIPKTYDIAAFYEGIDSLNGVKEHFKYINNYDYNKSIYLINKEKHFDNGFLLLKEDSKLSSPLAVVHYERYESITEVARNLNENAEHIQCVVSMLDLELHTPVFPFGKSQSPALDDYADGINTLDFLYKNQ